MAENHVAIVNSLYGKCKNGIELKKKIRRQSKADDSKIDQQGGLSITSGNKSQADQQTIMRLLSLKRDKIYRQLQSRRLNTVYQALLQSLSKDDERSTKRIRRQSSSRD